MKTLRRGKRDAEPLAKRSKQDLERIIARADKTIAETPTRPPYSQLAALRSTMEAAADERRAASAELHRRGQHEREATIAPLRHFARNSAKSKQERALDAVTSFSDPELRGAQLVAARLLVDDETDEAQELLNLTDARRSKTLTPEQVLRFEALVGKAAGQPSLYKDKRAEAAAKAKATAMETEQRRHPQSANLVSAIVGDEQVFDALLDKHRPDAIEIDQYGQQHRGTTGRMFDLDSVAALLVIVTLIANNGGHPIEMADHRSVGHELPPIPQGALNPLAYTHFIVLDKSGPRLRIGLGETSRAIAAKWGLELPEAEDPPAGG